MQYFISDVGAPYCLSRKTRTQEYSTMKGWPSTKNKKLSLAFITSVRRQAIQHLLDVHVHFVILCN